MTGPGIRLHHVACLIAELDAAIMSYATLGYQVAGTGAVTVTSQKVRVCFLGADSGPLVELVEPAADNRYLRRLLDSGVNFYHLGFLCSDLQSKCETMTAEGGRILTRFSSEAFDGRECVFILTPLGQMIELIEAATSTDSHAA